MRDYKNWQDDQDNQPSVCLEIFCAAIAIIAFWSICWLDVVLK
jgi:hypothetical protein